MQITIPTKEFPLTFNFIEAQLAPVTDANKRTTVEKLALVLPTEEVTYIEPAFGFGCRIQHRGSTFFSDTPFDEIMKMVKTLSRKGTVQDTKKATPKRKAEKSDMKEPNRGNIEQF